MACVILRNMIIEQHDDDFDRHYDFIGRVVHPHWRETCIEHFLQVHHEIRDSDTHQQLKEDLMEEWWKWSGHQNT